MKRPLVCPVCRGERKRGTGPYRDADRQPVDVPLEAHVYEGNIVVQRCAECDGLWLTEGQLKEIKDARENDYEHVNAMQVVMRHRHAVPIEGPPPPCPVCHEEMFDSSYKSTAIRYASCMSCGGMWILEQALRDIEAYWESFMGRSR